RRLERAAHHRPRAAGKTDALPLAARVKAFTGEHDAGLHELFIELAHLGEQRLARHLARLGPPRRFHKHHDAHSSFLSRDRSVPRMTGSCKAAATRPQLCRFTMASTHTGT